MFESEEEVGTERHQVNERGKAEWRFQMNWPSLYTYAQQEELFWDQLLNILLCSLMGSAIC